MFSLPQSGCLQAWPLSRLHCSLPQLQPSASWSLLALVHLITASRSSQLGEQIPAQQSGQRSGRPFCWTLSLRTKRWRSGSQALGLTPPAVGAHTQQVSMLAASTLEARLHCLGSLGGQLSMVKRLVCFRLVALTSHWSGP